jgi:hypothetical protein
MNKAFRGAFVLPIFLALLAGCGDIWDNAGVPPAGPPPGTGQVGSAEASGLKAIMKKIGQGPGALTPTIGGQLNAEKPTWETIQAETKEYAQLAADMAKYEPARGPKESWEKLCAEFAASAVELDKAAQAKDKSAALAAHVQLTNGCMGCHGEHRMKGPGGRGGPPRGPGPGGPGGPPPPGGPAPK